MLVLEPICLNLCLHSAVLLGILYLFFGAFHLVFATNHGFKGRSEEESIRFCSGTSGANKR
ncbi:hypothetical protein BGZ57DRAFT_894086 [Hyaloscypha finlandica]|nr:hypothetical protein BGZ57DRAFT_894086 [Hyaloscypha finlandica]